MEYKSYVFSPRKDSPPTTIEPEGKSVGLKFKTFNRQSLHSCATSAVVSNGPFTIIPKISLAHLLQ